MSRRSTRVFTRIAGVGVMGCVLTTSATFGASLRIGEEDKHSRPETYSIEYLVRISPQRPRTAEVRWNLAGIDEVKRIRLEIDGARHRRFRGSGDLEVGEDEVLWYPGGPYAHLEYQVALRHRRSEGKGFDSYATREWVITRSRDLFPATHIDIDLEIEPEPRSRSRVRFRLPRGWKSATAMEQESPHVFHPSHAGQWLDRPRGWIALGRLDSLERRAAGVRLNLVVPTEVEFPRGDVLDLYERALPNLIRLLPRVPPILLVVVGPDPMWRGGISGEGSIYLHADRPIRTPDRTSPPLHEAFHVLAPFRPGTDGLWITEGLAEYYSLELQRRIHLIDDKDFRRGLRSFRRWGRWDVNLSDDRSLAVTNNSAPYVIAAIDEWVRERTKDEHDLDDVLRGIVQSPEKSLTTAALLRVVKGVAGADLTSFVQRHVYAGKPPKLRVLSGDAHDDDR